MMLMQSRKNIITVFFKENLCCIIAGGHEQHVVHQSLFNDAHASATVKDALFMLLTEDSVILSVAYIHG